MRLALFIAVALAVSEPPAPRTRAINAMLHNAASKGLDPRDYDGPLPAAAIRYASDLRFGKVNRARQCELADWVNQQFSGAGDPVAAFQQLEPPFDGYWNTLRALAVYSRLAQEDRNGQLPSTRKPVEPGQPYPGVPRLITLLRELGDLPPNAPVNEQIYGGALIDAVKRFQIRHGLDADGRIGTHTLKELNTPLQERVRQLRLTLERWREVPHEFTQPPIVVNIPEFRVRAHGAGYKTELSMKVVVGKAGRLATPVFSAEMQYVIFRPYWNVPLRIQRKELVPKLERDRAYFANNDYEVTTPTGQVIETGIVSDDVLAGLRSGRLRIRQRPGQKNALGLLKFGLPNENDVYLHDTPAKELFSRSRRDFSHGCIRVENALELAAWVLRDRPEWTRERIQEAMHATVSLQVDLKHPIPVLIVYGTAVVQDDGGVSFFDDIYGLDAVLERQLATIRT